ncbi:MAG TPA: SIMPL domain-containing protein [Candidatus Paceibacterota bacterium]|nr:SIMPL domain-containing protein [Candidatus Paceibacterota bacterium]
MQVSEKNKSTLVRMAVVFLGVATLLLLVMAISAIKSYRYIGVNTSESSTITVSGDGTAFAVPDVAEFSFAVVEEADTVPKAQAAATAKANKVIAYLESAGIAEKDIQTTSYNISPRYEYHQTAAPNSGIVPPAQGTRVLAGYTVTHALTVKVRQTSKAGGILSQVGSLGVSDVSGLQFTVDNKDAVAMKARQNAIADAKNKANILANDLGVELVQVENFSDSGNTPVPYAQGVKMMASDAAEAAPAPELPTGENQFTSHVTITYKIR